MLKFGVLAFNWEPFSYTPKLYGELATEAERLGFDSFFVTDHFMRPHAENVSIKQHSTLEAWTLLAHLAARTSRIRLGSCVTPMPLRRPQILAKMVATVDVLSEGRVILGAGAGWDKREFDVYAGGYPGNGERVEMTKEGIQLLKRLWTEEEVDFKGKYYKVEQAILEPKPVQKGGPPIWTGAIHDRMLKMTAEVADGWIPGRAVGASLEYYEKAAPQLMEYARVAGKKLSYGVMGYFVAEGAPTALPAIGPMAKASELVQKYREYGCEYLVAVFFPLKNYVPMMRSFARDVVPSFQ
jgi:alkanesulfonate monooxygenase SsuD/methylene tetrahydromethanopterin reductase-like flavin-dependent oxidoreductase (luciferase family)